MKGVRVFWSYTNRFTEANAGGGSDTVKITPVANSAMRLVHCTLTMCDTAAGRATRLRTYDEDGAIAATWSQVTLDNQFTMLPSIGVSSATASNSGDSAGLIIVGDGSSLGAYADSLAQNEYFDISCCFELLGTTTKPSVAHTSTGTASTGTATQDEVTVVPVWG